MSAGVPAVSWQAVCSLFEGCVPGLEFVCKLLYVNYVSQYCDIVVSGVLKCIVDGLKCVSGIVTATITKLHGEISTEVYPALVSVGYICGFRIAPDMFAGGIIGWLVLIPSSYLFGQDVIMFPGTEPVREIWNQAGASGIWGNYIRYIGAGRLLRVESSAWSSRSLLLYFFIKALF